MSAPTSGAAQRPATDLLLADLATCVKNVREHEHPTSVEDFYCLNLTSYMGERMGAVLQRLTDEQTEVRSWKDRHTALAEEAAGYPARVRDALIEFNWSNYGLDLIDDAETEWADALAARLVAEVFGPRPAGEVVA